MHTSGCSGVQHRCCSPVGSLVEHSPVYSDQSTEKSEKGTRMELKEPAPVGGTWKSEFRRLEEHQRLDLPVALWHTVLVAIEHSTLCTKAHTHNTLGLRSHT